MSVPAKKRRIEKVAVKLGSGSPIAVPRAMLPALRKTILRMIGSEGSIPAAEVLPELNDPVKGPAATLRGFRTRDGLTQNELAARLEIEQGDLSKMENGRRSISKPMAEKLAGVFSTSYRVFL